MSFVKILLSVPDSAVTMNSAYLQLQSGINYVDPQGLQKLMADMVDGSQVAYAKISTGSVQASGTVTFTSTGPVNNETMVVASQTITAKTSATPGALEFTRSNTPSTDATNLAALINSHSAFTGIVTASASSGVVTLTAVQPGVSGNTIVLTEAMTNTAASGSGTLASGSDGTQVAVNFGKAS